jgi:hypothetical protein
VLRGAIRISKHLVLLLLLPITLRL